MIALLLESMHYNISFIPQTILDRRILRFSEITSVLPWMFLLGAAPGV